MENRNTSLKIAAANRAEDRAAFPYMVPYLFFIYFEKKCIKKRA
jgi:hypothetical protein